MISRLNLLLLFVLMSFGFAKGQTFNIKTYGAVGDGKAIDSPAINQAIEAASKDGGGTVYIPAGTYLCFSIRLQSNISLYLEQGATLLAATPKEGFGEYDMPEANIWGDSLKYQDFGHSHWHNSLIWGENLVNISILGNGLINGRGLTRFSGAKRSKSKTDSTSLQPKTANDSVNIPFLTMNGQGNKAIALKLCRNVNIRDISILNGGHFALLLTGVDNLTLDNLKIDTNRDGIDIDACRNAKVSNCSINAPWDDGLCLKASFALGYARACENICITNCYLSGFDRGTLLDGTFAKKTDQTKVPDKGGVFGRIKLGTESNGDYRNIAISNCVFENSRGLALESVDGSNIEDITITNITMRDINSSPIFLRLGSRMRGPKDAKIGHIRRVAISNITVYNADSSYCSLITGIPGNDIEDVQLDNIQIWYRGGGTKEQALIVVPEKEKEYPDPQMFGKLPAYGFYIRHARNITMRNIGVHYAREDQRPAFILDDVKTFDALNLKAQHTTEVPVFMLKNVQDFSTRLCPEIPDKQIKSVVMKKL
jgi:polygalacturonase